MASYRFLAVLLVALLGSQKAQAHEFWIDPASFVVERGAAVQANIRVGERFAGSAYSYNPRRFERFDLRIGEDVMAVEGRLGDLPALDMPVQMDGLVTIIHETTDSRLTYRKWEKFLKFVAHKAFADVLAEHDRRGIGRERFIERYRRYAKSLVAVGAGSGTDSAVGLKTEILALQNPYTTDSDTLEVQVLLDGAPRKDAQVELFERDPDGSVEIKLFRTNSDGIAALPVQRGYSYLVDAVTMVPLENDDPENGPVWWSLWASLTFQVPLTPLVQ